MNNKMAYEQIIASKLEALPLPDMADAIWARVEAQLDLDMPTGEPGGDAPNFPTGGFFIGGIGIIVLAFLLTYFSTTNNNQNSASPTNNHPITAPQSIESKSTKPPEPNGANSTPATNTANAVITSFTAPTTDSGALLPQPFVAAADSALAAPPLLTATPAVVTPKADTLRAGKKQRGVQGISDDDYRIVPKKDSAGK